MVPQPIDMAALARRWTHAHEEDRNDLMVFRTSDTPLPPSRGRMSFDLTSSGLAQAAGPGPDDRTVRAQGSWNIDGNMLTLRVPGQAEQRFEIQSVDADRLVVRRA